MSHVVTRVVLLVMTLESVDDGCFEELKVPVKVSVVNSASNVVRSGSPPCVYVSKVLIVGVVSSVVSSVDSAWCVVVLCLVNVVVSLVHVVRMMPVMVSSGEAVWSNECRSCWTCVCDGPIWCGCFSQVCFNAR